MDPSSHSDSEQISPPTTPVFEHSVDVPPPRPSKPSSSVRKMPVSALAPNDSVSDVAKVLFRDEPSAEEQQQAGERPAPQPVPEPVPEPASKAAAFDVLFDDAFGVKAPAAVLEFEGMDPFLPSANEAELDSEPPFAAAGVGAGAAGIGAAAAAVPAGTFEDAFVPMDDGDRSLAATTTDPSITQTDVLNRQLLTAAAQMPIPAQFLQAGRGEEEQDFSSDDGRPTLTDHLNHELLTSVAESGIPEHFLLAGRGQGLGPYASASEPHSEEEEEEPGFDSLVEREEEPPVAITNEASKQQDAASGAAGVKRAFELHDDDAGLDMPAKVAAEEFALIDKDQPVQAPAETSELETPNDESFAPPPLASTAKYLDVSSFVSATDADDDFGGLGPAPVPNASVPVMAEQEEDDVFGDFSEQVPEQAAVSAASAPPASASKPAEEAAPTVAEDDFGDDFDDFAVAAPPPAAAPVPAVVAAIADDDFGDFEDVKPPTPEPEGGLSIPIPLPDTPAAAAAEPPPSFASLWKDGELFGPTRCKRCNAPMRTSLCLGCGDRAGAAPGLSANTENIEATLMRVVEWDTKCCDDPNSLPLVGLGSDSALRLLLGEADVAAEKPPQLPPRAAKPSPAAFSGFMVV